MPRVMTKIVLKFLFNFLSVDPTTSVISSALQNRQHSRMITKKQPTNIINTHKHKSLVIFVTAIILFFFSYVTSQVSSFIQCFTFLVSYSLLFVCFTNLWLFLFFCPQILCFHFGAECWFIFCSSKLMATFSLLCNVYILFWNGVVHSFYGYICMHPMFND